MRLTCLIDNAVRFSSSLWGEHGLSFLIETEGRNVLWDTGASGAVLLHNLKALDREAMTLDALALSHAHRDHTGGLLSVLPRYPGVPLYAHPALWSERLSKRGGSPRVIGLPLAREVIEAQATVRLSTAPQQVAPSVWTTGAITPRPHPQGGAADLFVRRDEMMLPDDYADDMALVLRVSGGVVLLCGCCHAGLRNTLATVRRQYADPLVAIIGGTHLVGDGFSEDEQQALVRILHEVGSPRLYLNHCTGDKALWALRSEFGAQVAACPAGTVLEF